MESFEHKWLVHVAGKIENSTHDMVKSEIDGIHKYDMTLSQASYTSLPLLRGNHNAMQW